MKGPGLSLREVALGRWLVLGNLVNLDPHPIFTFRILVLTRDDRTFTVPLAVIVAI